MKYSIRILSIIGLLLISQLARSDSITDTYTTGDTLTATKMNNIKSAVNDNDARIGDNESRIATLEAAPKANIAATVPTPLDDINAGFPEGSVWVDMTNKEAYILVDSAPNQAVWKLITNGPLYSIGDVGPAGGIVFNVTEGGLHGLEAAPVDQGSVQWGCLGTAIAGADGTAIGTGAQNTADILAGCVTLGIAARLADAYTLNGFNDWFLPSKDELNELYLQKGVVGGFASTTYWSSSEISGTAAWGQSFANGLQFIDAKGSTLGVRAVRAF